ncbi:MAG: hypothetical protein K1X36_08430 [Pyrinomonadaceae bacterium]|nr:hypothetical protein [Pyrinomonadaceae bacterium]
MTLVKTIRMNIILAVAVFGLLLTSNAEAQHPDLTKQSLDSFVAKLKVELAKEIDDEDTRNAIIGKWDERMGALVGTTMGTVVHEFTEDIRAVTEDDEIANKLKDKFIAIIHSIPLPQGKMEDTDRYKTNWIKFVQDGWYVAHFELTWDEPDNPGRSWKETGKSKGWQNVASISVKATNIRLKMLNDTGLVWQPQREILNKVLAADDLNKCYRVHGTALGSGWDNNCN